MQLSRPLLAMVAMVTTLALAACGADPAAAPHPTISVADLQRAGIAVVADESAVVADAGVTLGRIQAERMIEEVSLGGGVAGRDVDVLAPMAEGAPPTSYLVAAWVAVGEGTAAEVARAAVGERDWAAVSIPDAVFPAAVLALFASDLGRLIRDTVPADAADGPAPDAAGALAVAPASAHRAGASADLADAPCSTASSFLAATIKGVFDALRLDVSTGSGFFDAVIGVFTSVWNVAVEFARGVVQAVVDTLTRPVFEILKTVAAGLGAASVIISYLKGQQLVVEPDPNQIYRVAVGTEPDIAGRFVARAHELSKDWPPFLMDCVAAAGEKMPELLQPGAKAHWQIHDSPVRPGLVVPAALDGVVAGDHRASLDFVTGRESEEQAKGPVAEGGPIVTVEIEQKAVTDFLRRAEQRVTNGLKDAIVGLIPAPIRDRIGDTVRGIIATVIDPIAAQIRAEIEGFASGVFSLSGQALIRVIYHDAPDEDPTPPPTPPHESEDPHSNAFCDGLRELHRWTGEQMEIYGDLAPVLIRRADTLTELRPLAPARLQPDVDLMVETYRTAAALEDGTTVGTGRMGIVLTDPDYVAAGQRVYGYCGITE